MKTKLSQLQNLKDEIQSLKNLKLSFTDARLGRKLCLAEVCNSYQIINVRTNFMTFPEMYCFLYAIYMRENNLI